MTVRYTYLNEAVAEWIYGRPVFYKSKVGLESMEDREARIMAEKEGKPFVPLATERVTDMVEVHSGFNQHYRRASSGGDED